MVNGEHIDACAIEGERPARATVSIVPAIADTPPMKGNPGKSPKVGYIAASPFDPSEQDTVLSEAVLTS
jgi:hypothetical protein